MNKHNSISDILAVEREWAQAHRTLDLVTIETILSDHYRQIQSDGTVIGKQELLASYSSGKRYWEIAESSDHDIQLLGNVAVMIARWRGKGINDGTPFDYSARFMAIYTLEHDAWRLLSDVSVPMEIAEN